MTPENVALNQPEGSAARILILGAGGMLGHVLALFLLREYPGAVQLSARRKTNIESIDSALTISDLRDRGSLETLLQFAGAVTVINCVAVLDSKSPDLDVINSQLPRRAAELLDARKDDSRLIHFSTDGVFSGKTGGYTEESDPDPADEYAKSKLAGEVARAPHLTIRSSFYGPRPGASSGLFNQFIGSNEPLTAHRRCFWNGITTVEAAHATLHCLTMNVAGLFHLASERISKHDLLEMTGDIFQHKRRLIPSDLPEIDRSLRTNRGDISYKPPGHRKMLVQMHDWMSGLPAVYRPIDSAAPWP